MKKELDIDELLNGFIDEELTERQKTEVQRLILNDPVIAKRFSQLQRCRLLVTSLPYEQAPKDMVEQVTVALERKTLLTEQLVSSDERKGARQLIYRKIFAAAAMIGLAAVLATVIYTIVTPESSDLPSVGFNGRLVLKTNNLSTADNIIDRAIKDNGLADFVTQKRQNNEISYTITCSRGNLTALLASMDNSWHDYESTTLFVDRKTPDKEVVISDVSTEQIVNLITPPMPSLTSGESKSVDTTTQAQQEKKVRLTIVVSNTNNDN